MDEEARRQYDYITNGLKAESPEGIFTRAQINQASVSMWGNALTSYHHQCEAELERVEATISDPDERHRAIENIMEYYVAREVAFDRAHDAAVAQLYRENGIPIEDNAMPQEPEKVLVDSEEKQVADKQQAAQEMTHQKFIKRDELPDGLQKMRRMQTLEEYKAAKKEREEKEPEKYEAVLKPTSEQIKKLAP